MTAIKKPVSLVQVWVLCFTLLSLLVSIHADIFAQSHNIWMGLFSEPWRMIGGSEPVGLSEYFNAPPSQPLEERRESLVSRTQAPPPLYVFALDMSGSLRDKAIVDDEIKRYREAAGDDLAGRNARYCLEHVETSKQWKSINIAAAELCRLLSSVQVPANVALWAFGNEPIQVVPHDGYQHGGPRFLEVNKARNGEDPMATFFHWIGASNKEPKPPGEQRTDIQALLAELRIQYAREIEDHNQRMHIVIISDFIHDIGGFDQLDDEEAVSSQTEWESRYRISRQVISEHVRLLARKGKMLHLVVLQGGSLSFRNILPILKQERLNWAAMRETRVGDGSNVSSFDFLRSYREVKKPIVFYYTGDGISFKPSRLRFDLPAYETSALRIDLAADSMDELPPLKITLESPRAGNATKRHYLGTIWPGRGGYGRVMLRSGQDGDLLLLQPSMVLEPHEADRYRVLMAWQHQSKPFGVEPSAQVTYSIPIRFHKNLPSISAWLILGSLVAFALCSVLLLGSSLASGIKKARRLGRKLKQAAPRVWYSIRSQPHQTKRNEP